MFTSISRPKFFNKSLYEYSIKSTQKSIEQIIKKNNEERKNNITNLKINLEIADDSSLIPRNNLIPIIFIISMSSIVYIYYNSKR